MEQYVIITGTMKMLLLSALNLDFLTMVSTWVASVVILLPFRSSIIIYYCKTCFCCYISNIKFSVHLQEH